MLEQAGALVLIDGGVGGSAGVGGERLAGVEGEVDLEERGTGVRGRVALLESEARGDAAEQLGAEELEAGRVVDVVPEGELDDLETERGGAVEGLGIDGAGAPVDLVEELGVRVLEADEVVAAVGCGAEDDAVAGAGEGVDGALEGLGRNGGGVGVDEADTREAAGEEVFGGLEETLAEAGCRAAG